MRSTEKITNRRLQSITDWQSSAITITLSLNTSIHQQEPYTKLETIFESTRLYHTMTHTEEALSQGDLRSAVMGSRMKPTYE